MGSNVGLDRLSGKAHKLNVMQVKKLSSPGRYADGNCLYFTISESGSKSWLLRIVVRGRSRDMGLGSVDLVSLEEARDLAVNRHGRVRQAHAAGRVGRSMRNP